MLSIESQKKTKTRFNHFRFLSNYIFKSKAIIIIVFLAILINVPLNVFLVYKNPNLYFIKFTIIFALESVFVIVTSAITFSWFLFSKIVHDSTIYSLFSMQSSRFKIWLKLTFTVVFYVIIMLTITLFLKEITWIILGVNNNIHLSFESITYGIGLLLSFFISSISILISNNLKYISSLLLLVLFGSIIMTTSATPIFLSLGSSPTNLKWNESINQYNYAKLVRNSNKGTSVIYADYLKESNELNNKFHSKPNGFPNLLSIIGGLYRPKLDNDFMINSYINGLGTSLIDVSIVKKGRIEDVINNKNNLYAYSMSDRINLLKIKQQELENEIANYLNTNKIINNSNLVKIKYSLEGKGSIWFKVTPDERELIRNFLGNLDNRTMFYLFRDYSQLKVIFPNLFDHLKIKVSSEKLSFIKYIWLNSVAKTNIQREGLIFENHELSSHFPLIQAIDESRPASSTNINDLKTLVSDVYTDQKTKLPMIKIAITNSNTEKYHSFNITNWSLNGKIKSKDEWDKYIEKNSEYASLKFIYEKLKKEVIETSNFNNQSSYQIENILFEDNWYDIYKIDNVFDFYQKNNAKNYVWIMLLLIISITAMVTLIDIKMFKRKDVVAKG